MPTQQTKLTEVDIRQAIADRYKTSPNSVALTINPGYDGGPTDREAPSVSAIVYHAADDERERLIAMLMHVNDIERPLAERHIDAYLKSRG